MTIEVTEEQLSFLREIQRRLLTQDNRMTEAPIFLVRSQRSNRGKPEFVTACFTETAAQEFIHADGHNHKNPHIYADSGYRNVEWKNARRFFMDVQLPKEEQ